MKEQSNLQPSVPQISDLRRVVRPFLQISMCLLLGLGLLGGWAGSNWLPVLLIFAVLVVANLLLDPQTRRKVSSGRSVYAAAVINLSASALVVVLTGGASSPFWLMFLIGAIASAISFRGREATQLEWLNIGIAALALFGPGLVHWPPDRAFLTLAAMEIAAIFFSSAMVRQITTLLMQSGEKLQESEARFGRFIENAPDMIFTVSTTGIITSLNPTFETLTGWPRSEWLGRAYEELIAEQDRPRAREQFGRMLQGATLRSLRVQVLSRTGDFKMVDMSFSPHIRDGQVSGLLVIARDVTDEYRAQDAVALSERRFRAMVEHGVEQIALVAPDGLLKYENPNPLHPLGYPLGAFQGRNLFELVHPADLEKARKTWADVRGQPGLSREEVLRLRHVDGSWRWIEGTATNLLEEPAVQAIVLNYRDITQRRESEDALGESEDRYRRLVEHSPYGVVIQVEGKVAYANPAAVRLIGARSAEEIVGLPTLNFVHPNSRPAIAQRLQDLENGREAPAMEERFVRLDGAVIDVEVTGYSFSLQGRPAVEVVFHDITERKQAVARLREAEGRYRNLVEHLPAIIYIAAMDETKTRLYVSPQAESLVGFSTSEFMADPEIWRSIIHPEDRERVLAQMDQFFVGGDPFVSEYRVLTRDGRQVWFHDEAVIVGSETTRERFIHGIQFDITERKQAEEALHQAEERYRALVEQLPIVVYVNPAGNIHSTVYVSPQIRNLLGYNQAEWMADPDSWEKALHPDDRPRVFAQLERASHSGQPVDIKYRLLTRDGRVIWIRDQASLIYGSDGRPLLWQGLMANITQERQTQALQEAAYAIAAAVVTTPALDELYPEIHSALKTILPVENFFIALYDREEDLLSFPYFVDRYDTSTEPQKPGQGLTEYVLRTQAPLLATQEVFNDLIARGEVDLVGTDSFEWLGVPLKIKDQTIGVMVMQAYEEGIHFTDQDVGMAVYVSAQVAQAIERKRADEALQKAHDELELRVQERTAELAQANAFLQAMMDNTPDHIYFKDAQGRFIRNSRSQAAMMGLYDPSQVVGKTDFDFFPHAQRSFDDEQAIMRAGRPLVDYEEYIVWPDKRVTWVSTTKLPLRDQHGNTIGIFGISRDITNRKKTEQALRKAKAELESANRELDAFSYSVSHDLQAPLRAIDGYSRILAREYAEPLPEEARNYLLNIRESSRRMGQLIQDLLKLSRLSRQSLRRERVDLTAIAQSIVSELVNVAPDRSVEFILADDLTARGDSGLLRVAMENLFNNAWKYTSKREQARIEFGSTELADGGKALFIRDNGVGFDMAYSGLLFGAFQRLHSGTEFEGTGIGLATVQRIIHRHGGRVWAEAEVNKGATFYFTLQDFPLDTADLPPNSTDSSVPAASPEGQGS